MNKYQDEACKGNVPLEELFKNIKSVKHNLINLLQT